MAIYPVSFWSDPSLNKPKQGKKKEVKKMACKTTNKKCSKSSKKRGK